MKLSGLNLYDVRFTSKDSSKKEDLQDFGRENLKEESNSSKKLYMLYLLLLSLELPL